MSIHGNPTEPIQPEILERLAERAEESGTTINELLRQLLAEPAPKDPHEEDEETIGQRLRRKGLLGAVDSSRPDPKSPPRPTPLGQLVAEKLKKQGLIVP